MSILERMAEGYRVRPDGWSTMTPRQKQRAALVKTANDWRDAMGLIGFVTVVIGVLMMAAGAGPIGLFSAIGFVPLYGAFSIAAKLIDYTNPVPADEATSEA